MWNNKKKIKALRSIDINFTTNHPENNFYPFLILLGEEIMLRNVEMLSPYKLSFLHTHP